jgi:hypothetical protein
LLVFASLLEKLKSVVGLIFLWVELGRREGTNQGMNYNLSIQEKISTRAEGASWVFL